MSRGLNGLMEIMVYNNNQITLSFSEIQQYKKKLVNKCFAILGVYEDCQKINQYDAYSIYLDRIKKEFVGFYKNTNNIQILSIINILTGMQDINDINHKSVKSLVFHLISMVQKMEV